MTYPTKLRKGDTITLSDWSATWDGKQIIVSCGTVLTKKELKKHILIETVYTSTCGTDDCTYCEQSFIGQQLLAEGAI